MAESQPVDLLVVGGGINGVGIARDAAGRGLSVLLCEQGDLAGGTSSKSSKLIHGGLRYLEHLEVRLVREALIEREVLLRQAPHIVRPLRFILPHAPGLRPAWMIRAGLFLYDRLGGRRRLPGSAAVNLREDPAGAPLKRRFSKGFSYADCWVDDARLVVLNAIDAAERGAAILPRTRCVAAHRAGALWRAALQPADGGPRREIRARALVNAAGPWVAQVLTDTLRRPAPARLRLVKGSHIVLPKLYDHDAPYILQNADGRVVFVIPFADDHTLIGTTDVDYAGEPGDAAISGEEAAYLCAAVNRYFQEPVTPDRIVWSYAGVRPLHDDAAGEASAATRDYAFALDGAGGQAPLLSVFGGKLTTYRTLAEHALAKLQPAMGFSGRAWTAAAPLPGGDMPNADFDAFLAGLRQAHGWLPPPLARRYARAYGTRVELLLGGASSLAGLGAHLGAGLYEAELDYLVRHEWARSAEDVLWRRSKLGLRAGDEMAAELDAHLDARLDAAARTT